MPTYDRGFQLGLLPEKKWDWRTFATSYGLLTGLILLLILVGIMTSDTLIPSVSYHVTELIPRPSLRPEALPKPKPLPVHAKLLPREPVFQAPKLIVPHEIRASKPQPQEIEPPKVAMNNFAPAVLKPTSGARPVLIHTGEFAGSSVTPTVNAPIEKVQTGGFGDPNGLKPSANSKPNGKLIASAAGSFDMPDQARATGRVVQKELRERLRAPISAVEWQPRARETGAGVAAAMRECRAQALARSRSPRTRRTSSAWIAGRRPRRLRSRTSRTRLIRTKQEI